MIINGDKIGAGNTQAQANQFIYSGNLTADTKGDVGGVVKLLNDTGVDIIITDAIFDITKASTGAATISVGVNKAGTTGDATLLNAINAKSVKIHNNRNHELVDTYASNAGGMAVWEAGGYIVATASATVAGMEGKYKFIGVAR